jgi:hypothetical protein
MSGPKNRPKRVKLEERNVMTTDQRPGFIRRWVNDENGRVQKMERIGYEIVRESTEVGDKMTGHASQVGKPVRKPVGGGKNAVLMEIPMEFYTEDQQAKEAQIKEKTEGLLSEVNGDGFYGDGVKLNRGDIPRVQNE